MLHQEQVVTKRTRAQVLRERVQIRLCTDEAGPLIAGILKENGVELHEADWGKVWPHWLIATVDDEVIACCQVIPSKPVGYVEFLFAKPSAGFKMRAIAIRKLGFAAMATLQMGGAQYVAGMVSHKLEKYLTVLKKMNFDMIDVGGLVIKRLT